MSIREIRKEIIVYVTTDDREFDELDYAERHQNLLDLKIDKTFNHGFNVGDLVWCCTNRQIHQFKIVDIRIDIHSYWWDVEKDQFYDTPAMLNEIDAIDLTDNEYRVFSGTEIKFLKRTIEELIKPNI